MFSPPLPFVHSIPQHHVPFVLTRRPLFHFGFTLPFSSASHCLFNQDRLPSILDALTLDRFEIHENMRVPEEKRKKNVRVNGGLYFWSVLVLRVFFNCHIYTYIYIYMGTYEAMHEHI